MNILMQPDEPFFERATSRVLLFFARRRMAQQTQEIRDLGGFVRALGREKKELQDTEDEYARQLEMLHAMGVRRLENNMWYFNFPSLLSKLTDDDLNDVRAALDELMDWRRQQRVKRPAA